MCVSRVDTRGGISCPSFHRKLFIFSLVFAFVGNEEKTRKIEKTEQKTLKTIAVLFVGLVRNRVGWTFCCILEDILTSGDCATWCSIGNTSYHESYCLGST